MESSINLTGTTLDAENDHISDNTKKKNYWCLTQFMIFLSENIKKYYLLHDLASWQEIKIVEVDAEDFHMKNATSS